eukprot:g1571.t1
MIPCLWGGSTPACSSAKGAGLLYLLLGGSSGSSGSSRLLLAAAYQHHGSGSISSSMLTATRRTSATRAPAMMLGRGCAGFFASGTWHGGGGRGRRRWRPSEATAPRITMISTAGGRGGSSAAAGPGEEEEEGRRIEGMISSMSPSSISAFKQCPQLFYFRYILRLKTPPTLETLKGIAVHEVLSLFFTLEKNARDLGHLHELFRRVMTRLIAEDIEDPSRGYRKLFESQEDEQRWVVECLDLLANFVTVERQTQAASGEGDPEHVELRMMHTFLEAGAGADTEPHGASAGATGGEEAGVMSVAGVVDRLDRCADGTLRVVDYKTGKVPDLKYPEATNKRIMDDKFFQLQIYALLVERVLGEVPGEMRLVYLKGAKSVTRKVDPRVLPSVEGELLSIWEDIALSLQRGSFAPRTSKLCGWCSFQDRCPAFQAG